MFGIREWTGHGLSFIVEQFMKTGYQGICESQEIQEMRAELGSGFWTGVNPVHTTSTLTAETMVLQPVIQASRIVSLCIGRISTTDVPIQSVLAL